jgi:hypothetical protein
MGPKGYYLCLIDRILSVPGSSSKDATVSNTPMSLQTSHNWLIRSHTKHTHVVRADKSNMLPQSINGSLYALAAWKMQRIS